MSKVKEATKNVTIKCVKTVCSMTGWTVGFTSQSARVATDFTKRSVDNMFCKKKISKNLDHESEETSQSQERESLSIRKVFSKSSSLVNFQFKKLGNVFPRFHRKSPKSNENIKNELKEEIETYEDILLKHAIRDVTDDQPSKRYTAVTTLGSIGMKMGVEAVIRPLMNTLKDSNGNIRSQACKILVDLKATSAFDEFFLLLDDNNPRARLEALRAIYKLSTETSSIINHLIEATKDCHREVRKRAATYLGWVENESAVNSLIILLSDSESIVRKTAVLSLGELRNKNAISPLIHLLNDKDDEVREMIAYTLRELTGQDFGYNPKSAVEERNAAIDQWHKWWDSNKSNFVIRKRAFVVSKESTIDYWERVKKDESAAQEVQEKVRQEAQEKTKRDAEEKVVRDEQEKVKLEAQEKVRQEAEVKSRQEAEERAKREAEEKSKQEAQEKARQEAEAKSRQDAEEIAEREAEEKAKQEVQEKARQEVEAKSRQEVEEKVKRETEEKSKQEAEEKVKLETQKKDKQKSEEVKNVDSPVATKKVEKTTKFTAEAKAKMKKNLGTKLNSIRKKLDTSKKSRK